MKTWLYKGSSKVSNTEVITDGDIYARSFPHHIFFQEVMDFSSGHQVSLRPWCDEYSDEYTLLHFYAFNAEITLLGF